MRISVVGAGVSGVSLAILAEELGNQVLVSDMKDIQDSAKEKLESAGISFEIGHKKAFEVDLMLLSSGIPPASAVVTEALERGIEVMGELEFVLPKLDGKIIGVTGTNGKSTTTTLISHLLHGSFKVASGGNLGEPPLSEFAGRKFDYIVLELSSFQLHYLKRTSDPKCIAAVITNLAPDHLDWHGGYEKYVEAKSRLLSLLNGEGAAFVRDVDIHQLRPENRTFALSWEKPINIAHGYIRMENERACIVEGGKSSDLFSYSNSPLLGKHNLENIAYSIALVKKVSTISDEDILSRLLTYKGLPHRCELVGDVGGVRYVNDSKGTNVGAAVTALESIDEPKIIILGGKGKGEDYSLLARKVKERAKLAIVIGSEREVIARALNAADVYDAKVVETLEEAVKIASKIAVSGDVVLLSPACTSWDQYKNFGERGEHFKSLVSNISAHSRLNFEGLKNKYVA